MKFRQVLFWLHLVCGVVAGIVIAIMSITGVLLTYEKQITSRADRSLYPIRVPADSSPVPVETLAENLRRYKPDASPATFTISPDPAAPLRITVGRGEIIYADPYTGEILGAGNQDVRKFFRAMTDLHRWLALSGESRSVGRALTGTCNLAFLFVIVSGFYLWWPKKWTSGPVRSILWFRRGLNSKARDYNWHHVLGFWCTVPLVLVIASAVVISYPWASNLVFRMAGSQPPALGGPPGKAALGKPLPKNVTPGAYEAASSPPLPDLNPLISKAKEQTRNWKSIGFRLPERNAGAVSFTIEERSEAQPQHRSTVVMDLNTGDRMRTERFENLDRGLRWRIWLRFVHTGEYYGLAGQTIAGIVTAASIVLVWAGIALTIRRFGSWIARKLRSSPQNPVS